MTNKTTAQYVNEQVGKEMKELEARLVAAGYVKETEMNTPKTVTYPVKFEEQEDGSWMAFCRDLRPEGEHAFLTDGDTLEEARINAADALDEVRYQHTKKGINMPTASSPKEGEELITSKCDENNHVDQDTLTYPVKFEQEKDGSWVAVARGLSALGVYSFLTNGQTLEEVRKFAGYELWHLSALLGPVGELLAGEELVKVVEEPNQKVEELEAEISKLQNEQNKRQKETTNLVLELRQYVERYRNANTRAIAAEMKFAEFVCQGVLKMTPNGHEPVLTRDHIDETVFMCKIRANRMAESFHEFKYQNNNAFATPAQREEAETKYMTALQLFNDTFSAL